MRLNIDVSVKNLLFYFFLVISTVLYIYSFNFWGINISLFRGLFVLWCVFFLADILFFKKPLKKSYGILYVVYILIILLNLADWLRFDYDSLLQKNILNHIIIMSLVCLVVAYINTGKKLDAAIRLYLLGSIIALFIAVFSLAAGQLPFEGLIRTYQSEQRESVNFMLYYKSALRFSSSFVDPTFYGIYLCSVIILGLYIYNYVEKKKYILVLIPLNIAALFMTMSRTALIGFAVIIAVAGWKIKGFLKKMIWVIPVIGLCSVFLYFNPGILDSLIPSGRFSDTESFFSRFDYYAQGLRVFADNPIFGGGTQLLADGSDQISSAHLVYLSILAKYGVVGFFIYSIFLLYPVYYVLKKRNKLQQKYIFLIVAVYSCLFVIYLGYDVFQFLEFQYLMFGFMYSIVLNRLGIDKMKIKGEAKT